MKFPYLKQPNLLRPQEPWFARPIIPIHLAYRNNSLNLSALIDSGADFCLFNAEIGRQLGIQLEKGRLLKFLGIEGSTIDVYLHPIELGIIGTNHSINIPVGFTESQGVVAILGQKGFFDAFRIKFERDRGVIEITPARTLK